MHCKKTLLFVLVFAFSTVSSASTGRTDRRDSLPADAVVMKYHFLLHQLCKRRNDSIAAIGRSNALPKMSPYYYRIFSPPTLYNSPLRRSLQLEWKPTLPSEVEPLPGYISLKDSSMSTLAEGDHMLARLYVENPVLVKATEEKLLKAGEIKRDTLPQVPKEIKYLAEEERTINLLEDIDTLRLDVYRPNFWLFRGNQSLQFTQSYFSENWFQGGDNNYSMLALATLEAIFDNKKKVQWENKLEMRLGFQTNNSDEVHNIRANDDLLRLTTKIGVKATTHWYYTLQVQGTTQFYPNYHSNSENVASDFMSPYYMAISLGMDYKLNLKRFNGSAVLTPVSYNFTSVERNSLKGNFGLEAGKMTRHYFGPSITVNYYWKIIDNIEWWSRIYWFSNLEQTKLEWENTIAFNVNKFVSARLFLYPRIDDSSSSYKNEKGKYFMFKEWFSLGVNYSF